jgi:hypothetical protein
MPMCMRLCIRVFKTYLHLLIYVCVANICMRARILCMFIYVHIAHPYLRFWFLARVCGCLFVFLYRMGGVTWGGRRFTNIVAITAVLEQDISRRLYTPSTKPCIDGVQLFAANTQELHAALSSFRLVSGSSVLPCNTL